MQGAIKILLQYLVNIGKIVYTEIVDIGGFVLGNCRQVPCRQAKRNTYLQ